MAMYMRFDGRVDVPGEASDSNHVGWIMAEGLEHYVGIDADSGASAGTGVGHPQHGDMTVDKHVDKASPRLNMACSMGTCFDKVTIDVCRGIAGRDATYLQYELENVLISRVELACHPSSGQERPRERVRLRYAKVTWNYYAYDDVSGEPEGLYSHCFDLRRATGE